MAISNHLSNLFGKSPIRPIQQHMSEVATCTEKLRGFFDAAHSGDWENANKIHKVICKHESVADDMKRSLRQQLPKSLFMPIDRRDLLSLLATQDEIADRCQDIVHMIMFRKLVVPAQMKDKMDELVDSAIITTQQALKATNELDELLETGFSGREVDFVEGLINKLDDMEDSTDDLEQELQNILLGLESELPPVDVMFLYQLIDMIGDISDTAENVGDRLHQMLAR